MKVINLFAGPGAGKTTTATGVFHVLKGKYDINCEYVPEFAKILAWEDNMDLVKDQLYVTAKQNRGLERLRDKVDYVVTDSPVLLGIHYAKYYRLKSIIGVIKEIHDSYESINFFINRKKKYNPAGRFQTEDEAIKLDHEIKAMLGVFGVKYFEIDGDETAVDKIVEILMSLKSGC